MRAPGGGRRGCCTGRTPSQWPPLPVRATGPPHEPLITFLGPVLLPCWPWISSSTQCLLHPAPLHSRAYSMYALLWRGLGASSAATRGQRPQQARGTCGAAHITPWWTALLQRGAVERRQAGSDGSAVPGGRAAETRGAEGRRASWRTRAHCCGGCSDDPKRYCFQAEAQQPAVARRPLLAWRPCAPTAAVRRPAGGARPPRRPTHLPVMKQKAV